MPLPPGYTEDTLVAFMRTELGAVGVVLGWDFGTPGGAPQVEEALIDALLLLDVADLADATNLRQVRAAARLAIWQHAYNSAQALYDVKFENGQTLSRHQLVAMVQQRLAAAEGEVAASGLAGDDGGNIITRDLLRYPAADPYAYAPVAQRTVRPGGGSEWTP